jgi:hypothetical protein
MFITGVGYGGYQPTNGWAGPADHRPEGLSYCEGAAHYFFGEGDVTIPFSSIDPGWGLSDFGVDGCSYGDGTHTIHETKVTETLWDGIGGNAGPGQVTIFLDGALTYSKTDCSWSFEGTVTPERTNRFNFDRRNRGFPREQVTTIIRNCGPLLGGQDFDVNITGERAISEEGDCNE